MAATEANRPAAQEYPPMHGLLHLERFAQTTYTMRPFVGWNCAARGARRPCIFRLRGECGRKEPATGGSREGTTMKYVAACLIAAIVGGLGATWLLGPAGRQIASAQDERPVSRGPRLPQYEELPQTPPAAAPVRRPGGLIFNSEGLTPDEAVGVAVYERNNKSVVNITTKSVNTILLLDVSSEGSGSGSILDREGHILTNYHVIE